MKRPVPGRRAVVGAFAAAFFASSTSLAQAPANDDPAGAFVIISGGCFPDANVGATNGAFPASCGLAAKDVWYYVVPSLTGLATLTTCPVAGSGCGSVVGIGDTVIAAFADAGGAPGAQLGCNDDACVGGPALASTLEVPVVAGSGFFVSVSGFNGASGTFVLDVAFAFGAPNDCYATALPLAVGFGAPLLTPGTNVGATTGGPCSPLPSCGPATRDVWYSFVSPVTGGAYVSCCTLDGGDANGMTQEDTILAAWDASGPVPVQLACDDDTCGVATSFASLVTFDVVAGQSYFVQAASWGGNPGGSYVLAAAVKPPPANDECATATIATPVSGTTVTLPTVNTAGATASNVTTTCGTGVKDVWYQFTSGAEPHVATVVACSQYASVVPVVRVVVAGVEQCCNSGGFKDCAGGYAAPTVSGCSTRAAVTFNVLPSTTYCISVGASDGKTGSLTVQLNYNVSSYFKDTPAPEFFTFDGVPNALALRPFTLNLGNFPNGWFGGLDIPVFELISQLNWPGGLPFIGVLDATGSLLHFSLPAGSIPPGITVYTTLLMFDPLSASISVSYAPPYQFTT